MQIPFAHGRKAMADRWTAQQRFAGAQKLPPGGFLPLKLPITLPPGNQLPAHSKTTAPPYPTWFVTRTAWRPRFQRRSAGLRTPDGQDAVLVHKDPEFRSLGEIPQEWLA